MNAFVKNFSQFSLYKTKIVKNYSSLTFLAPSLYQAENFSNYSCTFIKLLKFLLHILYRFQIDTDNSTYKFNENCNIYFQIRLIIVYIF